MENNKIDLNDNDIKVIYALLENTRQTAVELSNKTGLSRQTVNKTITRLEENNVIWGHYPVINMKALGKKVFITLVKSKPNLTPEKALDAIKVSQKTLKDQKFIILYSGYYHGYYDWIVIFAANDIIHANKVIRNWKLNYGDTIEDIQLQEELMTFRNGSFLNPDYEAELKNIL